MTYPALIERITRSLAYMLRHQPEEFELELDAQGYGDAERIVQALNERLGEPVTMADLQDAIHSGDRPRYELVGTRVRALYGHSIDVEPGEPSRPPELLFVGISARDADRAMRYGLRGGRRRFLHLALTTDDAREGGRRTGRDYVVITVYALDAWEEGINFFDRKALFLAEQIPIEFLEIGETFHDGIEIEQRGGGRREHGGDRQRGGSHRGPMRERVPAPRPEPRSTENFEEEGFGEGSSESILAQRDHGAPAPGSGAGFSRAGEGRGDARGDRGSHAGGRPGGDRGHRNDPRQMQNAAARAPQAGERGGRWNEAPQAGSDLAHADRDSRQGSGPERRDFERGGRPERHVERNEPGRERIERPREGGGRRDEGGSDRGGRPARPGSGRPAPESPSLERAPETQPRAAASADSPGFGLGIFEEPAAVKRPIAPPARPAHTPPPPPPPPPAREQDPSEGGFGAGI